MKTIRRGEASTLRRGGGVDQAGVAGATPSSNNPIGVHTLAVGSIRPGRGSAGKGGLQAGVAGEGSMEGVTSTLKVAGRGRQAGEAWEGFMAGASVVLGLDQQRMGQAGVAEGGVMADVTLKAAGRGRQAGAAGEVFLVGVRAMRTAVGRGWQTGAAGEGFTAGVTRSTRTGGRAWHAGGAREVALAGERGSMTGRCL